MSAWAALNRGRPDAKTERLLEWVKETCCPTSVDGQRVWNDERIIIFTEYRATQTYIRELLEARRLGGDRLALMYGGMDDDERERVKAEFQHDPSLRPLRILLATDAASEGIDLQRHCYRLVHVEIPFSPTKLEQRNGRIDRHGQPAPEVLIHHFVGSGWKDATPERWAGVASGTLEADLAFLSLIARKIDTIRDDLGAAGPVLAEKIQEAMLGGHPNVNIGPRKDRDEAARSLNRLERNLIERIAALRAQLNESIAELHLQPSNVERVTAIALDLANQPPLRPTSVARFEGPIAAYVVPPLTRSWATTTRDLYDPIADVVRPITFDHEVAADHDDVVLAHLNHRLVSQAMRTLRAEIWSTGVETRLGRVSARRGGHGLEDLAVIAHARLVLIGGDGRRLHEEIITTGGRIRNGNFARWGVRETEEAVNASTLDAANASSEAHIVAVWPRIAESVYAALEARKVERLTSLQRQLSEREGEDAAAITAVLSDLEHSIKAELGRIRGEGIVQLSFDFNPEERDQLERNVDALQRRVDEIPEEIEREVAAVRARYASPTSQLFPAALEFLVPLGGVK